MNESMPPWEPPIAGTEAEHLVAMLERQRATFRWKADGLDLDGLRSAIPSSQLTLGGLLKHLALYDDAVTRSRERLDALVAASRLDDPGKLEFGGGVRPSIRRHVCDLIEEYGRHTGHADLLREAIDGRVGEDPPADWRPQRVAV
jgi:hypothetical protein